MPSAEDSPGPDTMGIELVDLESFICVVRAGSFSAAAARLHVTQPAVTGRVQRLERDLGVKLLRRTTRNVEPTPTGERLVREASSALDGLRSLVQALRADVSKARLQVVVAASPTLAAIRMPSVIRAYSERFPDVDVKLRDLHHADALAAVADGSADLAVVAMDADDARYGFELLWTDDIVLVVPHTHPLAGKGRVTPRDLLGHTISVVEAHQRIIERLDSALPSPGPRLNPPKVVHNLPTLLGMLDAGPEMILLTRAVVDRSVGERHAVLGVEIDGAPLKRRFGILTAPKAKPSAAVASFVQTLRQG